MKHPILLLSLFVTCCCHAQGKFVAWFDKDWKKTEDSTSAFYYRTAENKVKYYLIRDYYKSGKLEMEAQANSYSPRLILNGSKKNYYESGVLKEESNYKKGVPDGSYRSFYENGQLEKDIVFTDNVTARSTFNAYYSSDGNNLLTGGNGVVPFMMDDLTLYFEVQDSLLRSSFVIDVNRDTIYNIADHAPGYEGGFTKLASDISSQLVYPKIAKKKMEQGVVFVLFTIDETGKVTDATVAKGFYDLCDAEAVRTIKTLSHWKPAFHNGKQVKARLVQPVRFALTEKELGGNEGIAGAVILGVVGALVR